MAAPLSMVRSLRPAPVWGWLSVAGSALQAAPLCAVPQRAVHLMLDSWQLADWRRTAPVACAARARRPSASA
eukprot:51486-Pyramimonas_sp.AAC.1